MPFDEMNHDHGGGGDDPSHEKVEMLAKMLMETMEIVSAVEGVCLSCVAETVGINCVANCARGVQKAYGDDKAAEFLVDVAVQVASTMGICLEIAVDTSK
jgi:hypothetical protein